MAKIQKRAAFEGLQNSLITEAMYLLSDGKISEADFTQVFDKARDMYDEKGLWIARAQLRKIMGAKASTSEEPTPPSETSIEESTQ